MKSEWIRRIFVNSVSSFLHHVFQIINLKQTVQSRKIMYIKQSNHKCQNVLHSFSYFSLGKCCVTQFVYSLQLCYLMQICISLVYTANSTYSKVTAEKRCLSYFCHSRSAGLNNTVFTTSHWKCITGGEDCGQNGTFCQLRNLILVFGPQTKVQSFIEIGEKCDCRKAHKQPNNDLIIQGRIYGGALRLPLWRQKNAVLIFNVKKIALNFEQFCKCTPELYPPPSDF